jgi:CelD/BcsL family acetyltransferase involved in cellulose biosynthesis
VYASSWKPQEPNPGFMPAFMTLAAEQGCLRLGVLWRGDEAVAAQLWLVYPGQTAQIFKLAHVQGQEKWSAGSVLTTDIARHVIDVDGVTELDFLSGDDPYKADWMALRRERVRLVLAYPWSLSGWRRWVRHLLERRIVRT